MFARRQITVEAHKTYSGDKPPYVSPRIDFRTTELSRFGHDGGDYALVSAGAAALKLVPVDDVDADEEVLRTVNIKPGDEEHSPRVTFTGKVLKDHEMYPDDKVQVLIGLDSIEFQNVRRG